MNIKRREALNKLAGQIQDIIGELESLESEEQDYYDNMPESLQGGEKGENAQSAIDAITSAKDGLETAVSELEGIQ